MPRPEASGGGSARGRGEGGRAPFLPRGPAATGRPTAVLVVQQKPNASTDYYLRPRLEAGDLPWAIASFADDPAAAPLLRAPGCWVVVCRYIDGRWLRALRGARGGLSGLSLFLDDDMAAMMAEGPLETRLKVWRLFGRRRRALEALAGELWVSTPALAARHAGARPRLLEPRPFDDPAAPERDAPPVAVYHGTVSHGRERAFLRDLARRLREAAPAARLEIAGDWPTRLAFRGLPNVSVAPQQGWGDYLRSARQERRALFLAPLTEGRINAARSAVKVFDAARLGAAGLFADAEPYRSAVRSGEDGWLLPMQPPAWTEAVAALLADPARRLALAEGARGAVAAMRAANPPLFPTAPEAR